MTLTSLRAAAAFAACLLATPAVLAQPMPPGGDARPGQDGAPSEGRAHERRGPGGLPHLRGLDLSEAQQDRVFAILHEQAPKQRELDKTERKAREALRALRGAPQFEQSKAAPHAQALGQAIADQEILRLRTDARIMALLTAEQREQLKKPQQRGARQ
ncbi:Spy/CpxP family protein refolding chaperone [Massilia niastensis]|uniref:Spy/CpxP family protein refolding chaperone n=1 Tax=Massilia niastensis TaxID=544911 RepID=UPI0003697024|nr:periplasmic heavy metal sensor [Massilia niastensis]